MTEGYGERTDGGDDGCKKGKGGIQSEKDEEEDEGLARSGEMPSENKGKRRRSMTAQDVLVTTVMRET